MNEAEKERLIKKDIESVENRVRHAFNQGYEMGMKERQNTCGDVVSRDAVIMALTQDWNEKADNMISGFIRRIKALPSVTPQQRTGRWIDNHTTCSECKWSMYDDIIESRLMVGFNYCPNCGAKMEVEEC